MEPTTKEREPEDRLTLETAFRAPSADEPVLDFLADKSSRELRARPPSKLTANDRAILEIRDKLKPGDLLKQGWIEWEAPLLPELPIRLRTLNWKQVEKVGRDISRFQQQREVEKGPDGVERVCWQPTLDEVRMFSIKRALVEGVRQMQNHELEAMTEELRMAFFEDMDTHMVNAVYRKLQQFYTAVGLLFPSDNQKELLATLKEAWAPHR